MLQSCHNMSLYEREGADQHKYKLIYLLLDDTLLISKCSDSKLILHFILLLLLTEKKRFRITMSPLKNGQIRSDKLIFILQSVLLKKL